MLNHFISTIPLLMTTAKNTTLSNSTGTTELSGENISVITTKTEEFASELFGQEMAMEIASFFKIPYWVSELVISIAIIFIFWVIYKLFHYYAVKLISKISSRTRSTIDDKLIQHLAKPVSFIILTFGFYVALTRLTFLDELQGVINKIYVGALTLIAVLVVSRLVRILLEWYAEKVAEKTQAPIDTEFIPTLRKVANILIWVVGFLLILDQLGYEITTLIAGLGIGGLAVALALQDTLNNFFSGFYMMVDKPVRIGDFVKLDIGEEGFIEQIGWRTTRIRTFANNIIVIPNSKLAQSVITNYFLPGQLTRVYVECGVGYDSDLYDVEKIAIEVAKEVLNKIPGGDKNFEPIVRYNSFGDSNINFKVILSSVDFNSRFLIAHEYMKALFHRFKKENIEIAFPKRSVYIETVPANLVNPSIRKTRQESPPQPDLFETERPDSTKTS